MVCTNLHWRKPFQEYDTEFLETAISSHDATCLACGHELRNIEIELGDRSEIYYGSQMALTVSKDFTFITYSNALKGVFNLKKLSIANLSINSIHKKLNVIKNRFQGIKIELSSFINDILIDSFTLGRKILNRCFNSQNINYKALIYTFNPFFPTSTGVRRSHLRNPFFTKAAFGDLVYSNKIGPIMANNSHKTTYIIVNYYTIAVISALPRWFKRMIDSNLRRRMGNLLAGCDAFRPVFKFT
jgi:hypothetical protein